MRIDEVTDNSTERLVALGQFLIGRSDDTGAKKQISQNAFIELSNSLGISVDINSLSDLLNRAPLNNIIEPLEPNSGVVRFKGNLEHNASISVDKAHDIVDKNAKDAMHRGMKK